MEPAEGAPAPSPAQKPLTAAGGPQGAGEAEPGAATVRRARGARGEVAWCLAMLAVALVLLLHSMLLSGLARIPGDMGDARLVNYILEHSFRWEAGWASHASFWDSPIDYPARNAAASTENLLGAAPFYWIWRAAQIAPDSSFELWLLTVAGLDFLAAWVFLRRAVGASAVAAGAGAVLFCAAAARARELNHAQLMPQFYSLAALYALVRLGEEPAPRRPALWWMAAAAALVLQLWASFYLAWFLALGLTVLAAWWLAFGRSRRLLVRVLRRDWRWAAVAAVGAAVALWPLVEHSSQAVQAIGWRPLATVLAQMPDLGAWADMGPGTLLFRGGGSGPPGGETAAGLGWVTLCLTLAGFWLARRRPWCAPLFAATLTLAVLSTRLPGGVVPWELLLPWFPGVGAIRAVARVTLVLLIPCMMGVAVTVDRLRGRLPWLAALLLAACFAEQAYSPYTFLKSEARRRASDVAARVPAGCQAFRAALVVPHMPLAKENFASIRMNLDAMSAQLLLGIPTANGYDTQAVVAPGSEGAFQDALHESWRRQGLRPGEICVVLIRGGQ